MTVNTRPQFGGFGNTFAFITEQTVAFLNPSATISDAELDALNGGAGDYQGTTLTIGRGAIQGVDDVFGFGTSGASFTVDTVNHTLLAGGLIFANYATPSSGPDQNNIRIDFTGQQTVATKALVNNVLGHITYENVSDNPNSRLSIDYSFNDGNTGAQGSGGALTGGAGRQVDMTPVNDAPTLGGDLAISVAQNAIVTVTTADLTATDPDDAPFIRYTVTAVSHGELLLGGPVEVGGIALTVGKTFMQSDLVQNRVSFHHDGSTTGTPSFSVSVVDGFGSTVPQNATVNATVTGPAGSVSVGDAAIFEGDSGTTVETFTVTRTGGTAAFDVVYSTVDGSATVADNDYGAGNGTLHFGEGVNTQTVSVTINGDTRVEGDETVRVFLGAATNGATIADDIGIGTIINDDGSVAARSVAIGDATIHEGDGGAQVMTFTATRSGGSAAFDVNFTTSDGSATVADHDYVATTGTLHFDQGVNTQTVSVTINGDTKVEGSETLLVNLSGATDFATISDGTGVGTITNDDGIKHAPVNDFNGDGMSDILWRSDAGTVATWDINDGQTISNNYIDTIGPLAWKIAGTGDFNGDAKSDMLWRSSAGSIVTWDMDDGKSLKDNSFGKVPDNWKIAGIGDFNGDAKSDILWRSDAGTIATWDMNDGKTLSNNNLGSVPANWKIAGTGDFNGDGKSDILWHSDAGTIATWDMNDGQVLATRDFGVVPNNWKIAGTGDFNGDGMSDLLLRSDAGTVVTWDIDDGQVLSTHDFGVVPNNWKIAGTGDFNGDGKSDILWRSDAGTVATWDINDGQVLSTHDFGVVPNDWHIV